MLARLLKTGFHLLAFAGVVALAAYWAVRIMTPPPTAAPPPAHAAPPRDPDPLLAGRMFGKLEAPAAVASNVQLVGVFAAGRSSSAVIAVDGKPGRAYVLGQDVTPGARLVEVSAQGAVLDGAGGRTELKMAPRQLLSFGGAAPAPGFVREGNTLTAPAAAGGAARPAPPPPPATAPAFAPGSVPNLPSPEMTTLAPPQGAPAPPPPPAASPPPAAYAPPPADAAPAPAPRQRRGQYAAPPPE